MDMTQDQISRLVDTVVARVRSQMGQPAAGVSPAASGASPAAAPSNGANGHSVGGARVGQVVYGGAPVAGMDGVYPDMDQAIAAAGRSYEALSRATLADRQAFVAAMRQAAEREAERLGYLAAEETGLGNGPDKVKKVLLAARKTPGTEDLVPTAYTGDDGLSLVEPAPFGILGAVTPSTNPPSTVVNNGISFVAAGNVAVFNPHPAAKRVSLETIQVLNRAIVGAGGPPDVLCAPAEPTLESGQRLMEHPAIRLLLVTGGEMVTHLALTSGTRAVAAGPGNAPVIVDDTAPVSQAAKHIVDGASFDNGVLCIAEKAIFVFRNVADRLKEEMRRQGAYELGPRERDALVDRVLDGSKPGLPTPKRDCVGRSARDLLGLIGIQAPPETRLVLCEVEDLHHPLVQAEQLMPFLPLLRVEDLDEALACALQAEHGFRHTAVMHSENVSSMSRVAREIETTIFVKNAPSYAGIGFGGEGFTTLSIAGPTGEGITSARTFTRQRRCVLAGAFRIV